MLIDILCELLCVIVLMCKWLAKNILGCLIVGELRLRCSGQLIGSVAVSGAERMVCIMAALQLPGVVCVCVVCAHEHALVFGAGEGQ